MIYKPGHLRGLRHTVEEVQQRDFTDYVMAAWDEKTEWFPATCGGSTRKTFVGGELMILDGRATSATAS
jgi:hypothetical protein